MSNSADRAEEDPTADVTRLLNDAAAGKSAATEELFQAVYDQLRQIARQRMGRERPDHTLQPTALVHEAYLRLVGDTNVHWQGRAHFFAAAAEAMRRILVERARQKSGPRRGGHLQRIHLDEVGAAAEAADRRLLLLDEARGSRLHYSEDRHECADNLLGLCDRHLVPIASRATQRTCGGGSA